MWSLLLKNLEASGLSWKDLGSFEEFQKHRFAKGVPHGSCGPPFAIELNFQVWIMSCESGAKRSKSTANRRVYKPLPLAD